MIFQDETKNELAPLIVESMFNNWQGLITGNSFIKREKELFFIVKKH